MIRASELRQKSGEDLNKLLLDLRREQFNLRMQKGSGQAVRPSRIRALRHEIARIKTVMNEKRGGVRRG
jgi:large subunit ribosomal protein L29